MTDAPRVKLEWMVGDEWTPALHASGKPIESDGPEIERLLETEPTYDEALNLPSRTSK